MNLRRGISSLSCIIADKNLFLAKTCFDRLIWLNFAADDTRPSPSQPCCSPKSVQAAGNYFSALSAGFSGRASLRGRAQARGGAGVGRGSPGLGSLSKGRPCQAGAAALGPLGVSIPEEEGGTDSAWIVSTPWPVERRPTIFRGPAERSSMIPGGQG